MSSQNTDQNEALAIGAETQLFVDDAIVSAKRGVVRTLHPGKKLAQPVLLPDRPWEGGRVYIYGTVHYDADAQQFRMWYLTRIGRGHQHRAPGLRERQGDLILYATSSDGLNWEKPELGLHEFDGSRANNILLFDKHSPTVIVDEAADPSERYKMAGWDWSREQFGYWVAHSADGLVWNEYDVNPILMNSTETLEAITVAHHSRSGEYFAFHRRWGDIGSFDAGCILCSVDRPIVQGDEVWHFYTAINTMHGGPMPPKTATIARASWRLDGFVPFDAGHFGGTVETVPLTLPSGQLVVNADASQGSLAVELLSPEGETVPGYSSQDCTAVDSDSVRHVIRWQNNQGVPTDQPLRLRFHLDTAQLYSFRVKTTEHE